MAEVAQRVGVSTKSIHACKALFSKPGAVRERADEQAAETRRASPKRATPQTEAFRKGPGGAFPDEGDRVLRARGYARFAFIEAHPAA